MSDISVIDIPLGDNPIVTHSQNTNTETMISEMLRRIEVLEKQNKELAILLRRAEMQQVSAYDEAIKKLKETKNKSILNSFLYKVVIQYLTESRRGRLQIVSFLSKLLGFRDYQKNKNQRNHKYGFQNPVQEDVKSPE